MKKNLLACAMLASAFSIAAEGYQVNTLSARQNGMGHTGTALKLDAESMIFNPAGLGFMENKLNISGSFTSIFATAHATLPAGEKFSTDNVPSTPMSLNLGFRIYDNLCAGISFYTPYGSNINWGENWKGAVLNQSVKLSVFTIQPTVAWRPIRNLSIGAGLMVSWGTVNLNKGLVDPATFGMLVPSWSTQFGSAMPASINLTGTASPAVGVNLGVMYDITKKWTIGFNYRSKMDMKVKSGNASLSFANDISRQVLESQLGILDQANFKASMPCVSILNVGVAFKPLEKVTLAFDAQLSLWNEYKRLDIIFLDDAIPSRYNQNIAKNYRNSTTWHLGAEWDVTTRFDLRAGIMVDTPPMRTDNYNPETPGMVKIEPSVGFSFRPLPTFSIDFGFLYVAGIGRNDASVEYQDLLAPVINQTVGAQVVPETKTFTADYNVDAFIPSIGVSYSF